MTCATVFKETFCFFASLCTHERNNTIITHHKVCSPFGPHHFAAISMSLSFSLGRSVFGVADIDVHLAFAGYWAYSILSSLWAGQESWHDIFFLDAILFGPILLLTLLIHGLVHAYTAIYYGR